MSEFGGKMDGKIIPEKQIPDKNCKPETDQDYAELFKDDFDGIKTSGPDHSNEKIDTEEALRSCLPMITRMRIIAANPLTLRINKCRRMMAKEKKNRVINQIRKIFMNMTKMVHVS